MLPTASSKLRADFIAGLVVFLVALPLCLGIAVASDAPPFAGLLAGVVGGMVVGSISKSQTSVSGPAAGLAAVVSAQIAELGSFETFLLAVFLAGIIQVVLGVIQTGEIAAFFPSSVIKGLLAAIGILLILKQFPHLFGHDADPEGEMSFYQPDSETTFSELGATLGKLHPAASVIGVLSLVLMYAWNRLPSLRRSPVPPQLTVVAFGLALTWLFKKFVTTGALDKSWLVTKSHLVNIPVSDSARDLFAVFTHPDFSALGNSAVYVSAITIAAVASLEALLNIEAADRIDPEQRTTPPNRELIAQGFGNMVGGLVGAIPVTSEIVRSSININAGGKTQWSIITHGALLAAAVVAIPGLLNQIPLACLAAILIITGSKLASPALFRHMYRSGWNQLLPFLVTIGAIVLTDLLKGVLIGLAVSGLFIMFGHFRHPLRRIEENHIAGKVLRIELPSQVTFLNRAALTRALDAVPRGGHALIDARMADYIDPDVLGLIREYEKLTAPARGVHLSLSGFKDHYDLPDRIQYVDFSTRDLQTLVTPEDVLHILREGNERFRNGRQLTRDLARQRDATAAGQFPLAVVLSCIDSRAPVELVFDLGVGDVFVARIAGNVVSERVIGSMEYACAVAGAKLVLVMGHSACGAVTAAVDLHLACKKPSEATPCHNLDSLVANIQESIDPRALPRDCNWDGIDKKGVVDEVSRENVRRSVRAVLNQSQTIAEMAAKGKVAVIGAFYDLQTGEVEFFDDALSEPSPGAIASSR
ncbi:MAG: bifunctional SulP family inorganic anion transporter/carbonic anhydrase [Pirellulales bacterium]|nr:bifunctional SulP family inorganic anion transporter/carbonic anhydrase [Pirellulales bacterium]